MDKPREYLFSESLENFTYDDYIKAGDEGPFYTVVSAHAYTTLHAEALKLREALDNIIEVEKMQTTTEDEEQEGDG